MTSLQSPTVTAYGSFGNMPAMMPTAGYQYDINGRLSEMTMNNGNGPQELASATYYAAGQLQTLSWAPGTETRTYNSLGQLTGQSLPWYLNMTYNYSPTANNGRITSSVDGMTGESTTYTYDALNRLTAASNSLWSQTLYLRRVRESADEVSRQWLSEPFAIFERHLQCEQPAERPLLRRQREPVVPAELRG